MNTPDPVNGICPERAAATGSAGGWGLLAKQSGRSFYPVRKGRSSERAEPPMTKTLLTALSARSSGLDDGNGGPERGVYTQMRGIEQVRVGRRL